MIGPLHLLTIKKPKLKIKMAEKMDTTLAFLRHQLEMTRVSKSVIVLQNVAPTNLDIPEKQLERRSISPEQES